MMRPFFKRLGSKWLLSRHLPPPRYPRIIEPFAGSAGYSTRYGAYRDVLLIDADPLVAAAWNWLIHASPDEIRALPGREYYERQRWYQEQWPAEVNFIVQAWTSRSGALRRNVYSKRTMTDESTWREAIRDRIARQVKAIRSWRVIHGNWSDAPTDEPATWVIDPPYEGHREGFIAYRHRPIDYAALWEWIRTLRGQIIVHERPTATWLPVRPFRVIRNQKHALVSEGLFYWDTELDGPLQRWRPVHVIQRSPIEQNERSAQENAWAQVRG